MALAARIGSRVICRAGGADCAGIGGGDAMAGGAGGDAKAGGVGGSCVRTVLICSSRWLAAGGLCEFQICGPTRIATLAASRIAAAALSAGTQRRLRACVDGLAVRRAIANTAASIFASGSARGNLR
ncbi:MAG: hypothetical protein ABI304_08470 [Rudaea sp.]